MKILICENDSFGKMCAELFELEDIEVIIVDKCIAKMLDVMKSEKFDVLISDALLINDFVVAEAKKNNMKIIALSDYDLPEIRQNMSEYGVSEIMVKPFRFEELLRRVRSL